jgi:ketosteroid isomerase-like protein
MSPENVEIVRRAFEAHQRRDNEAIFSLYDPAIEIQDDPSVPWPARYCGFQGVRDFFRDRMEALPSQDVEVEEWIDAGDDVIAVLHFRARGRQSGVPLDFRQTHVWTVQNGKLTRLRIYQKKVQGLEAAGVTE